MKARCTTTTTYYPTDSALAANNSHHQPEVVHSAPCHICKKMIAYGDGDKTGRMHQNCATSKNGKVALCGMCGEYILHTGDDKLHENCRSIR